MATVVGVRRRRAKVEVRVDFVPLGLNCVDRYREKTPATIEVHQPLFFLILPLTFGAQGMSFQPQNRFDLG